jgi:hypothetical protein
VSATAAREHHEALADIGWKLGPVQTDSDGSEWFEVLEPSPHRRTFEPGGALRIDRKHPMKAPGREG